MSDTIKQDNTFRFYLLLCWFNFCIRIDHKFFNKSVQQKIVQRRRSETNQNCKSKKKVNSKQAQVPEALLNSDNPFLDEIKFLNSATCDIERVNHLSLEKNREYKERVKVRYKEIYVL